MNTAEKCAAPDGVLLIDKPAGMTSHDVVSRVRRLFGTRQVGHTGTLDPMATGVLILLLGRAAKASEYVSHDEKSYEAVLRLGLRTDTEDTTGVILSTAPAVSLPDGAALDAVLPRFRGKICQIPPMYSALKVGGRKLCDIARAGGTVERQPRPVEIRSLTAEPASLPSDFRLHVTCSGGTDRYASAHRLLFRQNILLLPAHQLHRHPGSHPHPLSLCPTPAAFSPYLHFQPCLRRHLADATCSSSTCQHYPSHPYRLPAYQSVAGRQHRPSSSVTPSVDASLSGSRIWLPGPCQMEPDKGKNLQDSPFSCITFLIICPSQK